MDPGIAYLCQPIRSNEKEHWIHANLVHTSASTTASELESDKLEDIYEVSENSANMVMPTDIVEQQIWEHWVRALGSKGF